ncbi:zinc ribbon domain-containing protein, partial [Oscillatoria salina]|uniref:zinc ribbon domain-containing protein n=1 Tax=Oscillatoria salina TaxID=331517 RepID=UPI001CC94BF7
RSRGSRERLSFLIKNMARENLAILGRGCALRLNFHFTIPKMLCENRGMFQTMLKYKAEWSGKMYIEIDRFFPSSKTCHVCLNQVDSLPLDVREWTCDCQRLLRVEIEKSEKMP